MYTKLLPSLLTVFSMYTAPTGIPELEAVPNDTSITISWERLDCLERNSDISGYMLTYSESETGSRPARQAGNMVTISGTSDENRTFIVSGLTPQTEYTLTVSAINSDNMMGPSATINITTDATPTTVDSTFAAPTTGKCPSKHCLY